MARDPNTPRSFGLIPRTPPGIQRAESPRLAAPGSPPAGARLVPVVRAYRLAAAVGVTVAVTGLACGLTAGFGGVAWAVFALLYVCVLGYVSRVMFSTSEIAEIGSVDVAVPQESTPLVLLRAAVLPTVIVALGIGITLLDSDRFFLTFIIGMNGGFAISQFSIARQLAAVEARAGVQIVGLLPLRLGPMSLDGKLWSRPATTGGQPSPPATA